MDIGESYVVRIYRRPQPSGKAGTGSGSGQPCLIGIVENPGTGQRLVFHDIGELWTVLVDNGSPISGHKRKPVTSEK